MGQKTHRIGQARLGGRAKLLCGKEGLSIHGPAILQESCNRRLRITSGWPTCQTCRNLLKDIPRMRRKPIAAKQPPWYGQLKEKVLS